MDDDLPSVHSHSDDNELWDSGIEASDAPSDADDISIDGNEDGEEASTAPPSDSGASSESSLDVEEKYERAQTFKSSAFDVLESRGAEKLPVKLADGKLQKRGFIPTAKPTSSEDEDEEDEEDQARFPQRGPGPVVEDVSTGARFGRPAVVSVISEKSRKARIQGAKEQLAGICQEIMAEPENSVCYTVLPSF